MSSFEVGFVSKVLDVSNFPVLSNGAALVVLADV
jgi:hypothetical protein